MMPVHQLLSRLRWDRAFARGPVEIGYHDRVERRIIHVPLTAVSFPADRRHVFELEDATGVRRRIPFHRVREVVIGGRRIWHRPPSSVTVGRRPLSKASRK